MLFVCLKSIYGKVLYRIIGDDQAPTYFKIDERDGIITIRRSLNEDSAEIYKVSGR